MTTGSISTGLFPNGGTTKIHMAKAWTGGDGFTILTRYTSKPAWNPYLMAHQRFRSSNPNRVGYKTGAGVTDVVDNHSWAGGAGSDPLASGYSTRTDGTITPTFPTSQFSQLWTAREELALLSKLLAKVKNHEANLGVSLAEVDKLAGTVFGTMKSIVYGLNDLRQLKFAQFARRFGTKPIHKNSAERLKLLDVSGRFLEMRYAWEPTIQDCYAAAKAFEEISNGPRQLYNRATKRRSRKVDFNTNYCKAHQVVEAKRTYLFEMYEEMSFARQLGLMNPATIVWERMPFSFVIDWFIPIGTYLDLIGQVPFMQGRWCRTSSYRRTTSGSFPFDPAVAGAPPTFKAASPNPDAEFTTFNLERTISFEPPKVPTPNFRVQGAVHGKRIGNAIALAHQLTARMIANKPGIIPALLSWTRLL